MIGLIIFIIVFFVSIFIFSLYNSYSFQIYIRKKKLKNYFINDFVKEVRGRFFNTGYFAMSHKFVSNEEFNSFSYAFKKNFSKCYNVVLFKTEDADWELFFYLVKENLKFSNILTVRVFPKYKIKSEGNVEKNYSRLNIFTNNQYLTKILEEPLVKDYLKWLLRYNGDILLISHNNLHFKAFVETNKISKERVLDIIKAINGVKNKIFKKNVIEY